MKDFGLGQKIDAEKEAGLEQAGLDAIVGTCRSFLASVRTGVKC